MPRGDGSGMQPGGRVQSPMTSKSSSLNTRLLPQGTGGLMGGRSALLQGSGNPPARPSNFISGAEPTSQSPISSKPVYAPPVPPVAERSPASTGRLNMDELRKKTVALLEEYFSIRLLDEALMCVEELKSPGYHPEFVKEAISLALEKSPPCVEPVAQLLEHLLAKKVLTSIDIGTGCLLYGSLLDDIAIDLPKAPNNFGEIMGKLILAEGLDFKVVKEVLKKMEEEEMFRKTVLDAVLRTISSSAGQNVLDSQASDIEACQSVL
ncbi:eukaryotic translation initiation factor isoform 4G-1 [Melia azedarach]|uniref:Eukaryotic translation initiation factor isoform 4G-1 n=1 Tax=Melia azedarach TaxID=155640 RepID=A0ACC1XDS1_MELAZ|nr:eukaryotic translation initiation factor isoform 4G-1 [Melia azedarach]